MIFNRHSNLEGKHAFLGASKYHWLNDDEDGLVRRLRSQYASEIGTILHDIARRHIQYGFKLNKHDKKSIILELLDSGIPGVVVDELNIDAMFDNLSVYVNDAIGYKMKPEVILYYSNNSFGTADAISFREKDRALRIHDYKSGSIPAHMEQLLIYEALFCLEYRMKPYEIQCECRIYQNNEVLCHTPEADEIVPIMDKIVTFDKLLTQFTNGEVL